MENIKSFILGDETALCVVMRLEEGWCVRRFNNYYLTDVDMRHNNHFDEMLYVGGQREIFPRNSDHEINLGILVPSTHYDGSPNVWTEWANTYEELTLLLKNNKSILENIQSIFKQIEERGDKRKHGKKKQTHKGLSKKKKGTKR